MPPRARPEMSERKSNTISVLQFNSRRVYHVIPYQRHAKIIYGQIDLVINEALLITGAVLLF